MSVSKCTALAIGCVWIVGAEMLEKHDGTEAGMDVSLAGLTLHVSDVDKSLEFYERLPGAVVVFHLPGRFALLRFGAGRLGLLADRGRAFHVEFQVPDLDDAAARFRDLGMTVDGPTARQWGERDILVHDPDGNLLEFGTAQGGGQSP